MKKPRDRRVPTPYAPVELRTVVGGVPGPNPTSYNANPANYFFSAAPTGIGR